MKPGQGWMKFFYDIPIYLFLLPLLFILNAAASLTGLIPVSTFIMAFLKVTTVLLLGFIILAGLFRSKTKSAVLTFAFGMFYLFFGNIKNGFADLPFLNFLSHYKVLLPLAVLMGLILIYQVRNTQSLRKTNLYLNLLAIIYFMIAVVDLIGGPNNRNGPRPTEIPLHSADSKADSLPSIYYLLFDCYPSSSFQKEMLGVDQNPLDSFMQQKGFYIIPEPKSNYNNTAFSMAATFRMEYLEWIKPGSPLRAIDYNQALQEIREARFFKILEKHDYRLENLSLFDFAGTPALKKEGFLTTTASKAVFYNTLWHCLRRDVWYQVFGNKKKSGSAFQQDRKKLLEPIRRYNERLFDSLPRIAVSDRDRHSFIYAHLELPHFPYFYDSAGRPYPDAQIYGDSMITHRERFREYISYTNGKIMDLITELSRTIKKEDIIILQSDHGLYDLDPSRKEDAFRNYSAFYFPDSNYASLYPGMSNVNTFRIVLNRYLGYQLPLLKDSISFIK